jgi:hypothetical protein
LSPRDNLHIDTDAVRRLSRQIELEQSFGGRDLDGWEARLIDLTRDRGFSRTRKGSGYKFSKDVSRTEVLAARDALFNDLQQFRKDADADLAACLQQELAGATERSESQRAAACSFSRLLARAHADQGNAKTARTCNKFTHIFVARFRTPIFRRKFAAPCNDPRQLLHRRSGGRPVPRRQLLDVCRGSRARRTRAAADHELSQRAAIQQL